MSMKAQKRTRKMMTQTMTREKMMTQAMSPQVMSQQVMLHPAEPDDPVPGQ